MTSPSAAPAAPAARASTEQRIIDAAEECFARVGVARTTVEDVAQAAGMSRATLYRNFSGGRDELILAVFLRDVGRFLDGLTARVPERFDPADAVVAGVLDAVRFVRDEPKFAALFVPDAVGHTHKAVSHASQRALDLCAEKVEPYFRAARDAGLLRAELDVFGTVEFLFRLIASLSLAPLDRPDAETAKFLRTYVVPALVPAATL
ncbi:TetR/AcrR family transcriptional regulator [Actinocorallia sp. API 0066]|uniref:TetR/AcrR family transcriptional regulator n=1 Tax=Actinocorallia sp. API 0066 TaxID=2896846 RepID=UPI001E62FE42|nr:TetR/AcrR family transcriptional regulator [Actinocorallia sp. API 0066]MCD0451350.1 TetR/AcrR family transcriptional regulator [Actinocorallia sp. API 0066]